MKKFIYAGLAMMLAVSSTFVPQAKADIVPEVAIINAVCNSLPDTYEFVNPEGLCTYIRITRNGCGLITDQTYVDRPCDYDDLEIDRK